MPLPTQLRTQFRIRGYAILEHWVTSQELSGLRAACDALLQEKPDDGGGRFHDIGRGDDRRFLRHRHRDIPAVESFVFGTTMRGILAALIGARAYLFNEQFVVKAAGTGASFAWHQDSAYVGFDHEPYVTAWIALDDTTIQNGCVYLLPRNLQLEPDIEPHRWDAAGKEKVGYEGSDPGIAAEVPAGSIVVFSSLTLHRSGPNTTRSIRRAYICQYSPEPILMPGTQSPKHFATELQTGLRSGENDGA